MILDIFSRDVPGPLVATRERAALASRRIAESVRTHAVPSGQLTVHADRGSLMRSRPVALLLADLGIERSHGRPHTSHDHPDSEAQGKTLTYRLEFPARFGSLEDARALCRSFFTWYHEAHRHAGIGLLTPGRRSTAAGRPRWRPPAPEVQAGAYAAHPERFVRRPPRPPELLSAIEINPPAKEVPPLYEDGPDVHRRR